MSEDPLRMAGLDPEAIEMAPRKGKKIETEEAKIRAQTNAAKEERLQSKAKGGGGPSLPSAPPVPEEPPKDRSKLLDKVQAYKEKFPHLKSRNKLSGKSAVEEIEDELHYYEQQLGTKDGSMHVQIFLASMAGLERVTEKHYNPLGLNLSGLSMVARDNVGELAPLLDELVIKYGVSMYVSPELRLLGLVGTMVYTVHSANSGDTRTAAALAKMTKTAAPAPADL